MRSLSSLFRCIRVNVCHLNTEMMSLAAHVRRCPLFFERAEDARDETFESLSVRSHHKHKGDQRRILLEKSKHSHQHAMCGGQLYRARMRSETTALEMHIQRGEERV